MSERTVSERNTCARSVLRLRVDLKCQDRRNIGIENGIELKLLFALVTFL